MWRLTHPLATPNSVCCPQEYFLTGLISLIRYLTSFWHALSENTALMSILPLPATCLGLLFSQWHYGKAAPSRFVILFWTGYSSGQLVIMLLFTKTPTSLMLRSWYCPRIENGFGFRFKAWVDIGTWISCLSSMSLLLLHGTVMLPKRNRGRSFVNGVTRFKSMFVVILRCPTCGMYWNRADSSLTLPLNTLSPSSHAAAFITVPLVLGRHARCR